MPLTITPGLGGAFQFSNFNVLGPSLITANLRGLADLPQSLQIDTLASAYQHLSAVPAANPQLLESLGQLIERMSNGEERTPSDSFVISRLITEWGNLKDSISNSNPPQPSAERGRSDPPKSDRPPSDRPAGSSFRKSPVPPSPRPPADTRGRGREASMRFYTEQGGFFPPVWADFSKDMRQALKVLAYGRDGKVGELVTNEEAHVELLVSAVASWVVGIKTALEGGAKGAGQSGLASAPSVKLPVALIGEMADYMSQAARNEAPLASKFWHGYGANVESRNALNRLTTMRTLLSSLEEPERAALETALYGLDAAYLSFLLAPLAAKPGEELTEAGLRDEAHGETLAARLGEAMLGFPMVTRELTASQQVALSDIEAILRVVSREVGIQPPTPAIRAFLKKLNSSEMLRLGSVAASLRERNQGSDS